MTLIQGGLVQNSDLGFCKAHCRIENCTRNEAVKEEDEVIRASRSAFECNKCHKGFRQQQDLTRNKQQKYGAKPSWGDVRCMYVRKDGSPDDITHDHECAQQPRTQSHSHHSRHAQT